MRRRSQGTNPRALGANPRAEAATAEAEEAQLEAARHAAAIDAEALSLSAALDDELLGALLARCRQGLPGPEAAALPPPLTLPPAPPGTAPLIDRVRSWLDALRPTG